MQFLAMGPVALWGGRLLQGPRWVRSTSLPFRTSGPSGLWARSVCAAEPSRMGHRKEESVAQLLHLAGCLPSSALAKLAILSSTRMEKASAAFL